MLQNRNSKIHHLLKVVFILLLFSVAGYQLWLAWPKILLHSFSWQREVNDQLSNLLYEAKENNLKAGIYLIGLSFLYGIFHSIGPGHGKVIVTTFLATHPAKIKHGLVLTTLSATMQAIVAIILVSFLVLFFGQSMRDVSSNANNLISVSFLAMSFLGGFIIWHTLKTAYQNKKHAFNSGSHSHHDITATDINQVTSWKSYAGIIFSIGIRPCSGAILVLLFSNTLNIYWLGVISALLMAIGTAITTSLIALITVSGKEIIRRYILPEKHASLSFGKLALQFLGGILLLMLGIIMYSSQTTTQMPIIS